MQDGGDGLDTGAPAKTQTVSATVPVETFELEKPFAKKQRAKRISLASVDYPPRVVIGWDAEIRVTLAGSGITMWASNAKRVAR